PALTVAAMSGGCVGVEALTAGSTALLDGQLQTLLESWNPLDCLLCRQELVQPVRLSCHHSFCRRCLAERNKCPACDQAIEGEPEADDMVNFLIETSHESADVCANCDKVDWCSGLKNHHSSLPSLEDAGSIPAEGGSSPNQGAHPSVRRGIGSSYAAVVST
uniref:RING-type domain-containing protein n=1 Tax=Plectus sambesii TaxID=2011161 RepID=A0A914V449_9BILA